MAKKHWRPHIASLSNIHIPLYLQGTHKAQFLDTNCFSLLVLSYFFNMITLFLKGLCLLFNSNLPKCDSKIMLNEASSMNLILFFMVLKHFLDSYGAINMLY